MNALLALLLIGQTQIVVDPASKSTIEIKTQAQISVLPTGVKIVNGGITIFLAKDSSVVPAPDVKPTPIPVVPEEPLSDRSKDFLDSLSKSVPDASKRSEACKVAIPVIESIIGQAGGLGWTQAQVIENLAIQLNTAKFGDHAKGFKFGDWLAKQDAASVEDLVAVLRDVLAAMKGVK